MTYGRFEYPLKQSSTKFFNEFEGFTTAVRDPHGKRYAIILTESEEADTFVRLKLTGVQNVDYTRFR